MKRADLNLSTTYAARRSRYGPATPARVLDLTTLYTRAHTDPPGPFTKTGETRAMSNWHRTVGLLCANAADPADLSQQFLIDPRRITGTWEEHLAREAAEAAARKTLRAEQDEQAALREDQHQQMTALAETLELLPTQLPLLRYSSSQRVPNEVLLTLLHAAVRDRDASAAFLLPTHASH